MQSVLKVIFALLICIVPQFSMAEEITATDSIFKTAQPFYSWVLAHPRIAMPSKKERAELTKFMTPELIRLMKDAQSAEKCYAKITPKGNKPMMFEGALLVGNYEGATEVAYGEPKFERLSEGIVTLPVTLVYIERQYPKAHRFRAVTWNDVLELRLQGNKKWLIYDIHFSSDESLRTLLKGFIGADSQRYAVPN
ncbi:MAG: hypothetical protein LBG78_10425 [Azoarcus sp.]|jgi:hypothetical protein|nr:hypothetical protein [Azoarcus sp.]